MLSPSNILTFFVLLYYILTMIFPHKNPLVEEARIFPQTVMALVCIYCSWVSINKCRTILQEKMFQPFFILMIMGGVYVFGVNNIADLYKNILTYLKAFMSVFFMFTIYMHLQQDEGMAKRNIYIIFIMQIIYVFYCLWYDKTVVYSSGLKNHLFDSNSGFLLECCVPMSLILPIKRLRLYVFLLLLIGCVYSGQRSAALAAILCFPFCIRFLKHEIKKSDFVILLVAFLLLLGPIIIPAIENLIARHELDVAKGSMGSGRAIFWNIVWKQFWNNDLIFILFGNGYDSVQHLLKETYGIAIGAHNGWLDYLYVYGICGVIIYAAVLISVLCANNKINKIDERYKNLLLIVFILFFVKCTTSHGNWDITVMPIAMTIAIIVYDYKKIKKYNIEILDEDDKNTERFKTIS